MGTWVNIAVKTDDPDEQDSWPEGKELGPVVCRSGATELSAVLVNRYHFTKIDDYFIKRIAELVEFLNHDAPKKESLVDRLVPWLKGRKDKRVYFLHQ